ncbi:MAG: hypothetical protein AB1625_01780 [Acidobacteriota bacterium]
MRRVGPVLATLLAAVTPDVSHAQECLRAPSLEELVTCVVEHMPNRGSRRVEAANARTLAAVRATARVMLGGRCDRAALPPALAGSFALTPFRDAASGESFCLLLAAADRDGDGVDDLGWGMFLVRRHAPRELHLQVPHPYFDFGTELQGATLMRASGARSLLMAGAHRQASMTASACQPEYCRSDAAHDTALPFHAITEAILAHHERRGQDFAVLQLHSFGPDGCPGVDVHVSDGTAQPPPAGAPARRVRDALAARKPGWTITVSGDEPPCHLHGAGNVQGRLLNGVPAAQVCTRRATRAGGRFLHAEQKLHACDAAAWAAAIAEAWPAR